MSDKTELLKMIDNAKIDIVLKRAGHVFDMAAQDDFFSAPLDLGDTRYSFTGRCTGQGQF